MEVQKLKLLDQRSPVAKAPKPEQPSVPSRAAKVNADPRVQNVYPPLHLSYPLT